VSYRVHGDAIGFRTAPYSELSTYGLDALGWEGIGDQGAVALSSLPTGQVVVSPVKDTGRSVEVSSSEWVRRVIAGPGCPRRGGAATRPCRTPRCRRPR
jgi:hypothetical protein